jgi:hypothetical protein
MCYSFPPKIIKSQPSPLTSHHSDITWSVQTIKLFIMQVSPHSFHIHVHGSEHFFWQSYSSNTLKHPKSVWAGIASHYSDLLRAGRSGDRIPVGARFSAPVHTGPRAHPASCTMGTGSFPGVKRPRRGVDHPPLSSAEVKERVELYLYSPSGPSWLVLGLTLPLPLP